MQRSTRTWPLLISIWKLAGFLCCERASVTWHYVAHYRCLLVMLPTECKWCIKRPASKSSLKNKRCFLTPLWPSTAPQPTKIRSTTTFGSRPTSWESPFWGISVPQCDRQSSCKHDNCPALSRLLKGQQANITTNSSCGRKAEDVLRLTISKEKYEIICFFLIESL